MMLFTNNTENKILTSLNLYGHSLYAVSEMLGKTIPVTLSRAKKIECLADYLIYSVKSYSKGIHISRNYKKSHLNMTFT